MKSRVTFLRADRDEYGKKDGTRGVAHRITVITPEGHSGQVFIGGDNDRAVALFRRASELGQGEPVDLVYGYSVFRGDLRVDLMGIEKVSK